MSELPVFSRNRRIDQREHDQRERETPGLDDDALAGLTDGVVLLSEEDPGTYDPENQTLSIPTGDGGVVVQFNAKDPFEEEAEDEADDSD